MNTPLSGQPTAASLSVMGPKQRVRTISDDTDDQEHLAVRLIELLNDDQVLAKLKKVLFPTELHEKMDALYEQVRRLHAQLEAKDQRIKCLEEKVTALEIDSDNTEQYSRRANLRVSGLPEAADEGEDTDEKVLAMINEKMGRAPPLQRHHLERSHRVGRKGDGRGPPRAIIVRFTSERLRDEVYRARSRLKAHNTERRDQQLYINDDLTARRAKLAYDTRQLKKAKKLTDCWIAYGKVMVKDLTNKIKEIKSPIDLLNM